MDKNTIFSGNDQTISHNPTLFTLSDFNKKLVAAEPVMKTQMIVTV